jgi:hypothetical protein
MKTAIKNIINYLLSKSADTKNIRFKFVRNHFGLLGIENENRRLYSSALSY